jgi:hypothetical protein
VWTLRKDPDTYCVRLMVFLRRAFRSLPGVSICLIRDHMVNIR